ncbi:retrovirus-related pol polyprotein from transposon TNT 1-94, partial [Tanacetum coccineum]
MMNSLNLGQRILNALSTLSTFLTFLHMKTPLQLFYPLFRTLSLLKRSPEFTTADDLTAIQEPDHAESADILSRLNLNQWSREKHIDLVNIIGEPLAGITDRSRIRDSDAASAHECSYVNFLSKIKPKKLTEVLEEEGWVLAMTEEPNQFKRNKMDVKSAFLNGKISEEVCVEQPPGFESNEFPNHVCRLNKALYGLKQAPRAWYETLSKFLTQHKFVRGFQIKQDSKGIFICQEKYVKDLLKKYDLADSASVKCLMLPPNNLGLDESGVSSIQKDQALVSKHTQTQTMPDVTLIEKVPLELDAVLKSSRLKVSWLTMMFSMTRYHFIRDHILKGDIEVHFVPTELQLADIFTKPLAEPSFTRLVAELEVDDATKAIFKTVVPLPPKETVRAGLAILGLVNKDKPSLTSTELVNSSPLKLKYFSPIWKIFMQYTTPSASEVSLTSHMLKVAKLSNEPDESLILPSEEVNAEATADKSKYGTNVQPLSQPKAPTAKKFKKKKIPPSSRPKVSKDSREMNPPSTTTHLRETEEFVVPDVPLQSLEASVTAEVQDNQPKAADTTDVPKKIVEEEEVAEEQTMDSPHDTESEIKVVKSLFTIHLFEVQNQKMKDYEESAETQAQLNKKVVKQLNRQFNISYVAQSNRFVTLQKELSKVIKSEVAKKDVKDLLESAVIIDKTAEGEKKLKDTNAIPALTQGEHKTAENITPPEPLPKTQGELGYKESTLPVSETKFNKESAMVLYNPEKESLFETTSSKFSLTPPREPTHPRDSSKGKAVSMIEEPGNELVKYQEERGSNPKAPKLKPFITLDGPLSQEEYIKQIKELNRISDLKAEQEKLEQEMRKLLNPATLKAQAQKWTEREAKKAKMMEEYNHQIFLRADTLPITKISYIVNSRKEATIKITREDRTSPPSELATLITIEERKIKRTEFIREMFVIEDVSEVIKEVLVTKDVRVDGMDRNLIPPPGIMPIQVRLQRQIKVDSEIAKEMVSRMNDVIEARSDCTKAREILAVKGLSECKTLESNVRRIQVKDIVKEVEDHLKTYSSARMYISWIVGKILTDHALSYAFTATPDVPAFYIQQLLRTVKQVPNANESIRFMVEKKDIIYTMDMFRATLKLPKLRTPRATRTPNPDVVQKKKKGKQIAGESSTPKISLKIRIKQKKPTPTTPLPHIEKSDDDSGNRLEPESYKENQDEVINDEEKKDDDNKKKDDDDDDDDHADHSLIKSQRTGSSEIRTEKIQTPILSPPRSIRTDLSSDKAIAEELTRILKKVNEALKEIVPKLATSATMNLSKKIFQVADPEFWNALKAKYEKSCRYDAFRKCDHKDHPGDDAPQEREENAKRKKTYRSSKSAKGSSSKQPAKESNTSTSQQPQQQDFDAWRVPTIYDHERMEAIIRDMLSNQFRDAEEYAYHLEQSKNYTKNKVVWESRQEDLSRLKQDASVLYGPQRNPNEPPRYLYNKDLFFLKNGKTEEKKYVLSLYEIHATLFPEEDLEEKMIRWERVHDFLLRIESHQIKTNLTAPTLTFPGIKACNPYSIVDEPSVGLIYLNNKEEKRIMDLIEIAKFCDATLEKVLKEVKLKIFETEFKMKTPLL